MAFRQKIKYFIFSVIPLFVLLIVSEFAFRGYYYLKMGGYDYRIQRLVELKSAGPYYDENSKIANELGFSGKGRFDPRKLKNEYRILVLGGSAAAGSRDYNWPDVMTKELNKKGIDKHVRVLNGGIGGHTSSGEKKFMTRWMKLQPDLVIIYDGWNDMYFSHYLPEEYREQFEISNTYYYPDFGEKIVAFAAARSVLFRKAKLFAKRLKTGLKEKKFEKKDNAASGGSGGNIESISLNPESAETGFEYIPDKPFKMKLSWRRGMKVRTIDPEMAVRDDMSEIYRTNIREMIKLAAQNKVSVMLVVQPDLLYHFTKFPERFEGEGEEEDAFTVISHDGLRKDWINTTRELYPKVYEIMRQTASNSDNVLGVYRIDGVFDGFSEKFSFWSPGDSCHQTPKGREVIGKHIADLVYSEIFAGNY